MTDTVHVLYVAESDSTGERLESQFEDGPPAVALSFVTDVRQALTTLEAERIDYVILDSAVPERADHDVESALRREHPDVRVEVVPGITTENVEATGDQLRRTETGQVSALAQRIVDAVASETAAEDGVEADQFRALAEELSDGILVIDTDSIVRFANSAVADIFGYPPEEVVGESLTKLMPEDLAERHREGVRSYLREGERRVDWSYVELTGERRDGSEVPLGVSFSEFASGDQLRFTGIVRDISDRKRRESELRDRIRQQEALSKFSRHALEDLTVPDLMDEATETVADALDHEYAGVLEYRPDRGDLLARTGVGWSDDVWGTAIDADRDSQAGRTLLTEEPVVVEDLETNDQFGSDELLQSIGATSGISVVIGSPDDPWGVLGAHHTERRTYADHDVQFVQSIARILTTAIRRSERERRLERYETMLNAVDDGVYALDADSRFVAVNDAYTRLTGYDREELIGEPVSTVLGERRSEELGWVQRALEDGEEVVTLEATMPTAHGESIPVEARVAPLSLGDELGRVGVVRDVTDRKRRERKLTALNELLESLAEAETATEICDLGVDAAVEALGLPNAAVALYDDEAGALVSTVRRWSGGAIDDALLGPDADDVAWRAFVEGEPKTFDDVGGELDADVGLGSALAIPLGKYGVFLAAAPEPGEFDRTDRSLADMLCSNVRSALDRAEREETLRKQRNDLQEKNRELERANRINRVIREITKALTQASSHENVMQAVCDRLTQTGPYRFAWFGKHDRASDEVRPQAWAGVEDGYLEEVVVTAESGAARGEGPSGRAVRTQEIQVQNDLLGDPPFDPWREQALKRGYQSSVSVPIIYGGTLRGVLNLYAGETDVFNELEQAVLSELGETIGYTLNALEQKQALVSERSIELDFRVRGADSPLLAFVTQTGAEFEFENAVQRDDGKLHAFFTIRGSPPEETIEFAEGVSWIEDVRLVTERDEEYLYECTLADDTFLGSLVDRGAIPRTITASKEESRFVIRLPQNADVRAFVDRFDDYYDEVQLVARRERDEPVMTRQEFESDLTERLTDRQQEVLRTAYLSGFFEWPRESTAEEIADVLGVSQPTVSRHLRAAERALFGLLFEDT